MNCHGVEDEEFFTFFAHSTVFKYSSKSPATFIKS
jgi:hypothetical protein